MNSNLMLKAPPTFPYYFVHKEAEEEDTPNCIPLMVNPHLFPSLSPNAFKSIGG